MKLKLPPKKKPLKLPQKKTKLLVPAKHLGDRAAVPSIWHRHLAGVALSRPVGRGEQALDAVCRENDWTWGVVSTYQQKEDGEVYVRTTVLVGRVIEGCAQRIPGNNDEARVWDEHDQALMDIATKLEKQHGGA